MATYTIEVTETEHKALEHVTADPADWAVKTVKNRAGKAVDEICMILIAVAIISALPQTMALRFPRHRRNSAHQVLRS